MGGIVFGCIAPHAPILVSEIGGGQLRRGGKTVNGMKELADEMAHAAIETIVLVSPHSPSFQDSMGICTSLRCSGDFADFGVPEVGQSFLNDLDLVEAIQEEAKYCGIRTASTSQTRPSLRLDWGVMVPMYFLRRACSSARLVPLSFSWL